MPRAGTSSSRGRGRRTVSPVGGSRGSSRPATCARWRSCGRGPCSAAGRPTCPGARSARGRPGPATGRVRPSGRRSWRRRGTSRAAGWTWLPRTRRSRPTTRPTRRRSAAAGFHGIAGDPAVPAPDVPGAARGRRRRRRACRRGQVDAPADPARRARRRRGRAPRRAGGPSWTGSRMPGSPRMSPCAGSTTCSTPPASGCGFALGGPGRVCRVVAAGAGRRPPRLPGGARGRRDGPRAGRPRPVPPRPPPVHGALGRRRGPPPGPPGHDAPPPVAGDPAGPRRRAHRRWTWAAWTSRVRGGRRCPASPRSACTSTSARSGRRGWSWRGRRSGSASPVALCRRAGDDEAGPRAGAGEGRRVTAEADPAGAAVEEAVGREPRALGGLLDRLGAAGLVREVRPGGGAVRPSTTSPASASPVWRRTRGRCAPGRCSWPWPGSTWTATTSWRARRRPGRRPRWWSGRSRAAAIPQVVVRGTTAGPRAGGRLVGRGPVP